jgi:hypothetical protein
VDEVGCVYFETDIGFGLVHTADMNDLANAVEQEVWSPELVSRDSFEAQYGFRKSPEALQKQ